MKLMSIFLSMVILSLSFAPCCKAEDKCLTDINSAHEDTHCPTESEVPELPCLPFFSCGPCAALSHNTLQLPSVSYSIEVPNDFNDFYLSGNSQTFKKTLLKPPKKI